MRQVQLVCGIELCFFLLMCMWECKSGANAHTVIQVNTQQKTTRLYNLLCQVTGAGRRINDLVIEDGEVERQTETDRMRRLHFRLGNVEGLLIRFLRVLDHRCAQSDATQQDLVKRE